MLMTIVIPLLFLAIGLALILNTIVTVRNRDPEFPRQRVPVTPGRRLLPILLGAVMAVSGIGMLLVSRTP